MTRVESRFNPDLGELRADIQVQIFNTLEQDRIPYVLINWGNELRTAADKNAALWSHKREVYDQIRRKFAGSRKLKDSQISVLIAKTLALIDNVNNGQKFLVTSYDTSDSSKIPPHMQKLILREFGYGTKYSLNPHTFDFLLLNSGTFDVGDIGATAGAVGPWGKTTYLERQPLQRIIVPRHGDEKINDGINWNGLVVVDYAVSRAASILVGASDAIQLAVKVGDRLGMVRPKFVRADYKLIDEEQITVRPHPMKRP